jgi:hypothetical protein
MWSSDIVPDIGHVRKLDRADGSESPEAIAWVDPNMVRVPN